MNARFTRSTRTSGFTTLDVLIGIMLVAILSGIAVAAYQGHAEKAAITTYKSNVDNAVNATNALFAQAKSAMALGEAVATDTVYSGVDVSSAAAMVDYLTASREKSAPGGGDAYIAAATGDPSNAATGGIGIVIPTSATLGTGEVTIYAPGYAGVAAEAIVIQMSNF